MCASPNSEIRQTEAQTSEVSKTSEVSGRDTDGRFAKGNKGGPGNPFAREVAEMRKAFTKRLTPERAEKIADRLIDLAEEGNIPAAKLVLSYTLGKPGPMPDPDKMDIEDILHQKQEMELLSLLKELVQCPALWMLLEMTRVSREAATLNTAKMFKDSLDDMDKQDRKKEERRQKGQQQKEERQRQQAQQPPEVQAERRQKLAKARADKRAAAKLEQALSDEWFERELARRTEEALGSTAGISLLNAAPSTNGFSGEASRRLYPGGSGKHGGNEPHRSPSPNGFLFSEKPSTNGFLFSEEPSANGFLTDEQVQMLWASATGHDPGPDGDDQPK